MDFLPRDQVEYEEQNQAYSPIGQFYQPPINPQETLTLVTQTNPQFLIEEFEHKLKGEVARIDEKTGKKTWIKKFEPMANEHGVQSILIDIYGVVNQNTILSNLSDDEVRKIGIELGETIKSKIAMNWTEYGIKKHNMTTIVLSSSYLAFTALKRGMDQGERHFLKTAVRTSEQVVIKPKEAPPEERRWFQFWK